MENTEEQPKSELLGMNLDYDGGSTLHEAARWSKFQSIVSIVCGGLVLLLILIGGPIAIQRFADELPDGVGILALVIVAMAVYIAAALVAAIFLLRFTSLTKRGIETQDQSIFNRGLRSLKIYFVIAGVLSLFLLADFLYVIINQILS